MAERLRGLAVEAIAWSRARPFTVGVAALFGLSAAALWTATAFDARPAFMHALATGADQVVDEGRVWTLLTYPLLLATPSSALAAILGALLLIGFVERGARRSVLIAGTAAAILAGGAAGVVITELSRGLAAERLPVLIHDPFTLVLSALVVGSAYRPPESRVRIRLLVVAVCVVEALYLGDPAALYRAVAVCTALLIALLVRANEPSALWRHSSEHHTRRLVAAVVAMLGLGPLLALLSPHRHALLGPITALISDVGLLPGECSIWHVAKSCVSVQSTLVQLPLPAVAASALPWLLFLIAAWGIRRGRSAGTHLAIALCAAVVVLLVRYWVIAPIQSPGAGAVSPFASGGAATEYAVQLTAIVLLHLLAIGVLLRTRTACRVEADPRRVRGSILVVAATGVALVAGHFLFALLQPARFDPEPTALQALLAAFERLLPDAVLVANPSDFEPVDATATALIRLTSPLWMLVIAVCSVWTLRSRALDSLSTPVPHERVVAKLRAADGFTLGYLGSWRGNRYWRDETTGSLVAYRLARGVALALGVPFGEHDGTSVEQRLAILQRFASAADAGGLVPVAYSVPGELQDGFRRIGWSTLPVAEESIIDLGAWSTKGKRWQDIRTAINRATREGITVEWCRWQELDSGMRAQIDALNAKWVGDKPLPEMGFTLGGMAELRDPETELAVALGSDGSVQAVTSWLPVWRRGRLVGRTLDFMRRDPAGMNGLMEMMIARGAEHYRELGLESLSLSGAPLVATRDEAARPQEPAAGDPERLLTLLEVAGRLLEPVYGFRSLHAFKQKFAPRRRALIMAYPDDLALPQIALAIGDAYLPGLRLSDAGRALAGLRQQ